MTDHRPENYEAAADALWKHLSDDNVCMLWVKGSEQHPQPMTMFADRENGSIWFITSSETDLFRTMGMGSDAGLTLQSDDNAYIASLSGRLEPEQNAEKLDEVWSFGAAAWFEHGRDDPKVRLMRFVPREASVWASQNNPVIVGLKMMRTALTEGESDPNIGTHDVFELRLAA